MKNWISKSVGLLAGVLLSVSFYAIAQVKISELPDGGTIQSADQIAVNRAGTTRRVTVGGTFGTAAYTNSTAYEVPLTFGDGVTRTGNDIDVDTTQNISRLSSFTQDGFLVTGSGNGSLSVVTDIDITSQVTGILPSANGGTGNAFFAVSGPATSTKTYTLPNASTTILTTNSVVTVAQGGTGTNTLTGVLKGNGTSAFSAAALADITGFWSGTCNSTTFLRADGTCTAVEAPLTFNAPLERSGNAISITAGTYQAQDAALTALAGGSDFVAFSGPATSTKTFTLPNANATILTDNADVTVAQGGTGVSTLTGLVKGNGTSAFSAAAIGDVTGLFSGTCNSTSFMRGDGSCQPIPYDVALQADGEPEASAVLIRYVFPRAAVFADEFSGSYGIAAVAATAQTILTVNKNGSSVGTITFAASGTTGTFVTTGTTVSFAAGDIITITAPASPDTTLADLAITLAGTRG